MREITSAWSRLYRRVVRGVVYNLKPEKKGNFIFFKRSRARLVNQWQCVNFSAAGRAGLATGVLAWYARKAFERRPARRQAGR